MKKISTSIALSALTLFLSSCGASQVFSPAFSPINPAGAVRQSAANFQSISDRVLDLVSAQMRQFYFQNNDYNNDGFITRDETHVAKDGTTILDKWDLNRDGKASFEEFDKARSQGASGVNRDSIRRPATRMWERINTDQNDHLTREEVIAYYISFYDHLDDPRVRNYRERAQRNAVDFFVKNDSDIDQKMSFSEYEDAYAKQMLSTLTGGPINSPI